VSGLGTNPNQFSNKFLTLTPIQEVKSYILESFRQLNYDIGQPARRCGVCKLDVEAL
jgi:hypothetical protein